MLEKLKLYKTVEVIKTTPDKQIELVFHQIDHCFYIKRVLHNYDITTYQRLRDNPHPGFVQVIELYEANDTLTIIEEFINGPTLEVVLLNETLTQDKIIAIMNDICEALSFLHHLYPPLIHRDIKPDNIFYYHQHAIIFDFDITREYDSTKTKDTCLMGSVGYAAPEQFGFSQSDTRSDIYALGVLLNVLFTKQFPQDQLYSGKEAKIIQKATALDPETRYQSVTAFKKALNEGNLTYDESTNDRIPGFRQRKPSHMIVAILYYVGSVLLATQMIVENATPIQIMANQVAYALWFLLVPLFIFNYCGIKKTALFSQANNKILNNTGLGLTLFFWLFIFICTASFFK